MNLKILMLFLVAFMQTCIASDTTETPLSEAKKQQILADFREHDIAEKAYLEAREKRDRYSIKVENKRPSPEEACKEAENKQWCVKRTTKSYEEDDRIKRQREKGRYLIGLSYENDAGFSLDVVGGVYDESLSTEYIKAKERDIFLNYFGNSYEEFEPKVYVVNLKEVALSIYLTPEELSHFLSDARITYLYTPADTQIINQAVAREPRIKRLQNLPTASTAFLTQNIFAQTVAITDTQPVPLTEEQKQDVIAELQAYDLNKGRRMQKDAVAMGERSIDLSPCDDQGDFKQTCINETTESINLENQYIRQASQGRYSIGLYFPNDRGFDLKIVGGSYVGNLEDWDVAIKSREILEYYLGHDYEALEPKIMIIKPAEIGIGLFLTPAELKELVDDSVLHYISTPANNEQTSTTG